jgi:hypothetical protein
MTNREMSKYVNNMADLIEANKHWPDLIEPVRGCANALTSDAEPTIDDKKALMDLNMALLLDSTRRWPFGSEVFVEFDAVCEQLGVRNLDYNKFTVSEHRANLNQIRMAKMGYRYDVGVICSVRTGADKEYIEAYVKALEDAGHRVFYPGRDTEQVDATGGIRICKDNHHSFRECYEIHVIFHPESQGTLFDLGLCFAMGKPLKVVNPLEPTAGKSFKNMILKWQEENPTLFNVDFDMEIEVR